MKTAVLMPIPAAYEYTEGSFRLGPDFRIKVRKGSSERVFGCATRFLSRLTSRTGLFLAQGIVGPAKDTASAPCIISFDARAKVLFHADESYRLVVTVDSIRLTAPTDIGVLRGLETLLQLLSVDREGYFFPAVVVADAPRFPWRGLLIDVGRHFMPVDVIRRNLDGMAAVKMNVLHLHLSEDQGFRIECKTFPELHELGSDGEYFTQEQIREIIAYADERGIRVVPEFDIPGHATSWFVDHPELASAPGPYTIERTFGIKDPAFNPASEATYKFFDAFFREMAKLFPDEYLHIGGDENNGKQWDANPTIQAFMKKMKIKDNHELQSHFNKRILTILTKYKKRMVGWDEIYQPDIPNTIVIQSWRGQEALLSSARKGYNVILSHGYYIDLVRPASNHYLNDPVPVDSGLSPGEQKFILGGEATMWGEFVTRETIDSRIWPRTAAIAERLWSPASVRDVSDMYRRLDVVSYRLEGLGLLHEKNYGMMLRRLANNQDIASLKVFFDVCEPVKADIWKYRSRCGTLTPYTRTPDVARPDARTARRFRENMDAYCAGTTSGAYELKSMLRLWKDNHQKILPLIQQSPMLNEIEPLSANLSALAIIGLEAMDYRESGKKPTSQWRYDAEKIIEKAGKPFAETELMVVSAIEKLVGSLK